MPLIQPVVGAAASQPTLPAAPRRPLRTLLRFVLGLLFVASSLVLTAWLTLHWGILPRIEQWRPQIEAQASAALGVPVRIGHISASSSGWVPSFELHEVTLLDAQQRPALQLPRVVASISPQSVLAFELRFEQLLIEGAQLEIRRNAAGRVFVAGLDIGWATRKRKAAEAGVDMKPVVADKLCEAGRFGQKTGAGWYDYQAGKRDAIPSKVVVEMIEKHRAELGITPRKISDEEIVQRLVFALVNEGARIVEEGIALRASDIDMVYLTGYGFPLHRGGPMCYADTVGLFNVVQAMKRFAQNPLDDASFWQPAPLLQKLVAEGKTLT